MATGNETYCHTCYDARFPAGGTGVLLFMPKVHMCKNPDMCQCSSKHYVRVEVASDESPEASEVNQEENAGDDTVVITRQHLQSLGAAEREMWRVSRQLATTQSLLADVREIAAKRDATIMELRTALTLANARIGELLRKRGSASAAAEREGRMKAEDDLRQTKVSLEHRKQEMERWRSRFRIIRNQIPDEI